MDWVAHLMSGEVMLQVSTRSTRRPALWEQAVLDLVAEISEIQGRSLPRGFFRNTVSDAVMELTSVSFVGPMRGFERSGAIWPSIRSIKDAL